ncbi:hypothetical protein [Sneathiella sp.]|uniref:hypothetical protein n=1 Tax=Sneathiella sp. TaxID=1964365 RepID=UPI002623D1DB|nr:hypothetical protein [Sneathiella sp.]MDF2366916.1 hypothetical protein [Sneathiella sp.]
MNVISSSLRIMCLSILLAACTADGGTNNPVFRPFQWFSYANGDDIRANCEPGRNARYRMIYNAIYDEQVRTYDILQIATSDKATQTTRVFRGGISVDWLLGAGGSGPAATRDSKEEISLKDLIAIEQALIKSGFEQPAIKEQILHSDEFYWIAMVCREGNFKYYAWTDENADVAKLPFREVLSKGDKTGVPFLEPYVPVVFGRSSRYYNGGRDSTYFTMQIGENGLDL